MADNLDDAKSSAEPKQKAWQRQSVVDLNHGLPIIAEVDVVVVGGGAAGVAAADTAARRGLKTLLIERYGFCGGNAVAGLSGTICGMYFASDRPGSRPQQAVWGFSERFRSAMEQAGGITEPLQYGKTWTVAHHPLRWREVADAFMEDADVSLLYHAFVVGVVRDNDVVCGVIVETKAGRGVVRARITVDASGDADVIYRAGYDFSIGDNGRVQNPTMIFRVGGVDLHRYQSFWGPDTICSPEVSEMLIDANDSGHYKLPRSKIWLFPTPCPGELLVNATRLIGRDGRDLYPADPHDLTEAEIVGRRQVREYARFLANYIPGCENSYVIDTGVQAGIRQSRSIIGKDRISNSDVIKRRKRTDGIVRSPWPIELHAGGKPKLEWLLDDYYEVPYAALLPEKGENIIVAGRCLSAEHEALASARVTAQCFGYGHAAGLAAATAIRSQRLLREISGEEIRQLLNDDGARLDEG